MGQPIIFKPFDKKISYVFQNGLVLRQSVDLTNYFFNVKVLHHVLVGVESHKQKVLDPVVKHALGLGWTEINMLSIFYS